MNLTVSTLARSLADYLAPVLPGVAMYEDPNQQGSQPPCMFLQTRYNRLKLEMGGEWTVDLDAMHYKFELRERVTLPKPDVPKMQELELHQYMEEADHGR